ncbi:hypothetical protein T440DRAFT_464106 [Plenodomus tracheiphilus IPT5]|uniref:Uncharacterized protein n=1 Tax=Plenodomus tracheiphilus IPT5 TaxID=1408161 RepID=A0A6A7BJP8_9PLEO|nr:hypothetical protein T440DRAFT_464106 [Plenodomus tracheiphilus IPT5]
MSYYRLAAGASLPWFHVSVRAITAPLLSWLEISGVCTSPPAQHRRRRLCPFLSVCDTPLRLVTRAIALLRDRIATSTAPSNNTRAKS